MTRTFFTGLPTEEEEKVHRLVREAGELAESLVRPGIPLAELDRAARKHIEDGGYGPFFTHRLGHFIGLKEHEEGEVSASSPLIAQKGMIFPLNRAFIWKAASASAWKTWYWSPTQAAKY